MLQDLLKGKNLQEIGKVTLPKQVVTEASMNLIDDQSVEIVVFKNGKNLASEKASVYFTDRNTLELVGEVYTIVVKV